MNTGIVLTTINIPHVLETYIENCNCNGNSDVFFVVIGDKKTPDGIYDFIKSLEKYNYDVFYLDIEAQENWLNRVPEFRTFLPYNSVERRNIGYLYAAEMGADVIISVDDDNIPLPQYDYIKCHGIVGQTVNCREVYSSTGWFNTCCLLKTEPERIFYHRGYPVSKRWLSDDLVYKNVKKRVVVNVGLWIKDPDVDTITRLEEPFSVEAVKDPMSCLFVGANTMTPFNSQNTAFHIDVLPCLYLITFKQGTNETFLANNYSFRYDDIWMSYFMKKLIDHFNDAVNIGPPHVEQRRNEHDYFLDIRRETGPMELNEKLIDILNDIRLTGLTYHEAYKELTEALLRSATDTNRMGAHERQVVRDMCAGMKLWSECVEKITKA